MSAWDANSSARSCDSLINRVTKNDPTLTTMTVLPLKTFGDSEAIKLSDALRRNTHLTSLQCSGKQIGSGGLVELGGALSDNETILHLAIGHATMGVSGLLALCEGGLGESVSLEGEVSSENCG